MAKPKGGRHERRIGSIHTATIGAGLDVDALEQLAADLGPGLDRTHSPILGAAAHARASIELSRGQFQRQVDPAASEMVPAEAHP